MPRASAALAYLHREPGHERVARLLGDAAMSAVNAAEVGSKLAEEGASETQIRQAIRGRTATRGAGLSLGDRACLATAHLLGLRAVTADRRKLTSSGKVCRPALRRGMAPP